MDNTRITNKYYMEDFIEDILWEDITNDPLLLNSKDGKG
jgi:hypothetical protein